MNDNKEILSALMQTLNDRKKSDPESSYVASLYAKGVDAILKKIGEESAETIMAAKSGAREEIIHETADLWFHCMVMLANNDIDVEDVLEELERRFGVSGLDEKASRK
ncbi:MAG: phosphoribosyl-ATP diphosphatase [Pseudomonadota bacterium]